MVTPIDRIAPIARQLRPSFLVSQYVAITRFKRHIAFPADIVEMRSRVVLALRPARNLDHDLRGTADNASKPRPRAPALACPPRTQRAQQHIGPAPVRVAGQLWFEQRGKLSRLKAAIKVAHWKPPNRTGQLS